MNTIKLKISQIKENPSNPRIIRDDKYKKLVQSIKEFPKMLELRPIVVDKDYMILGGNQRLKACREAGYDEIPVIVLENYTDDEKKQFIIKDNVSFGEWDWDVLTREWESTELADWGLDVWQQAAELDYGLLEDTDVDEEISEMENNVKRAIQIEFHIDDYDQALELINHFREKRVYVGGLIIRKLLEEKNV